MAARQRFAEWASAGAGLLRVVAQEDPGLWLGCGGRGVGCGVVDEGPVSGGREGGYNCGR
jgi:hypothetical protein